MWDRERGMSSTAAGIVTYRGAVYASHCDHIGHMNIASYGAKFDEANWVLFCELGLTPSYLRGERTAWRPCSRTSPTGRSCSPAT